MSNASLIYESLKTFGDIKALIGTQEDIFLDFKESRTTAGALLDDDKAHFSKAASGFAHQEGGVLIWGIEARQGANEVDEAKELRPIPNIKKFLSGLQGYVKTSTEPVVDGIQSRVIYDKDDENSNRGYAVTFFPKSNSEHRSLGNTKHDFYRRHGDSFVPLSTADIRALFFRVRSPELELRATPEHTGQLRLFLFNQGKAVAKFPSVLFSLSPNTGGQWFDGEGNLPPFKIGWMEFKQSGPYQYQFMANANVVVHPEQEICILRGPLVMGGGARKPISEVTYRVFAENMMPKQGTLTLSSP